MLRLDRAYLRVATRALDAADATQQMADCPITLDSGKSHLSRA